MTEELTLLEQIARDYKAFKSVNQSRVARIPHGLKERVKVAIESGINRNALAAALGITPVGVQRWIDSLEPRPLKRKLRSELALVRLKESQRDAPKEDETIQAHEEKDPTAWIKLRVEGREVEVRRSDFWRLVSGI